MYYGSKMSDNITKTPEGYLICLNVPIGRTGWMDYLAEEIGIEEKRGQRIKVYRSPEELFSKATIASFEGKPVTNNHPSRLLDINTVSNQSRGHTQNIRPEGDFLLGDLFVTDAGLIAEIENGKREVSCGYDCAWIPLNENKDEFEQKEIVGNHVAVVQTGRAGHRVAIQDAAPEDEVKQIENTEREAKRMSTKNISKKLLAAIGFKHFVQDAEPEEIAKAMDAFGETEGEAEPPAQQEKEDSIFEKIMNAIKGIDERLMKLEQSDKQVHEEIGAEDEFAGLEKELGGEPAKDESSVTIEPPKAMDEAAEEEKKGPASDSLKKFVQDMKPVIMAIPDEKVRLDTAKQFSKIVRDSRSAGVNGYAEIVGAVNGHKKQAMDTKQHSVPSMDERNQAACVAWNKSREVS
jgi:hypothetical protein